MKTKTCNVCRLYDFLAAYMKDMTLPAKVRANTLYDAYVKYVQEFEESPFSQSRVGRICTEFLDKQRTNIGCIYVFDSSVAFNMNEERELHSREHTLMKVHAPSKHQDFLDYAEFMKKEMELQRQMFRDGYICARTPAQLEALDFHCELLDKFVATLA